jgi:hypothetical protein
MLTGQVPFFGSSPAEILMKHMTAKPELDDIEEPFARVIRKALAKDPADRYQTVQEMVEDVFGSEHVRNSVSQFSAEDLSIIAERIAQKVKTDKSPEQPAGAVRDAGAGQKDFGARIEQLGERIDAVGERVVNKFAAATSRGQKNRAAAAGAMVDPIDRRQRRTLALATMAVISAGAGLYYSRYGVAFWPMAIFVFVLIGAGSASILLLRWRWLRSLEFYWRWVRSVATGIVAGLCAAVFGTLFLWICYHSALYPGLGPIYPLFFPRAYSTGLIRFGFGSGMGMWLPFAIVLSLVDWWRMTAPNRSKRVSLSLALLLGFLGFVVALIFHTSPFIVGCVMAGTLLVVQIASPLGEGGAEHKAAQQPRNKLRAQAALGNATAVRLVPPWARMLWLLGFAILLGLGLILLIWTGIARLDDEEFVMAVSFGIGGLIFATFCLMRAFRHRFVSLYRYLIKPLLLLICLQSVVTASICLGSWHLGDDEMLVALFFIIFPAILFFVIAFVRSTTVEAMMGKLRIEAAPAYAGEVVSAFKRMWALLLSGGMFLGIFGLHRFYVGKIGTGIVWLLTFGLFGIGQVIDIILICVGQFKDCNGARLIIWQSRDELRRVSMGNRPNAAAQANGPVVAAGVPEQPQADQPGPVASAPVVMPTTAYEPFNPFGFLLSFVGYLLLLLALVIGLGLALHLTWLVAAGFPDQHLAEELQEEFGYAGWPQLVERIAFVVGAAVYMLAAAFIIVARRHRGAAHMIRGAFGLLGMLLCLWALSGVFPIHIYKQVDLVNSFEQEQIGKALDLLFGRADEGAAVWSAIFFIGSVIILAWPPRRSQPQLITTVQNLGAN